MRSARALPGFRGFVWSVRSRVARSIARRVATRDTTRLTPSRPVDRPDRHERDRTSESEGSRTRKRGRRRFSRVRKCWRSSRHAPAPLPLSLPFRPPPPPLPDAAASFGAFFSTVVQPSSTIARVSPSRARSPRKEGFALLLCSPNARRARGDGDDDADAFAREPGRFDAPASTGVRLPSAGTFTNAHRTRWRVRTTVRLGGADTRLSQTERGPLHFRPTLPHTSRESSKNAKRCSCRQVV